jgi:predicted nucleotidyltransferase component of viral defense system
MKIDLITRAQLERVARKRLQYPLHTAEKDYFLMLALWVIERSSLRDRLVFKGGTAIHHHYLPQLRFSEDLDFTSLDRRITMEEVIEVFEACDFFAVKKQYASAATIKLTKLQYSGILAQPNHIKIEIDHRQNVVLPPQRLPYHNAWGLDVSVNVMDVREICAEKLRAMSDRSRYRDFYDMYWLLRDIAPNFDEVVTLLRQKEVRRTIRRGYILGNWREAQRFKQADVATIFVREPIDDTKILAMIQEFNFDSIG